MQSSNLCDLPAQPDSSWWALYTRHQHEHVVADLLAAKDFEVFLPAYTSIRRWKDRQKVLSLPLFPCYVFVKGAAQRRLQVVSTPGVHMVLSHGEKAAVIPEHEIHAIRQTVLGSLQVEPHPFLRCGERVRVVSGSLAGVEGILIRRKNQFRLVLSVEMLEKSVSVEIDANAVEPTRLFGASPAGQQVLARLAELPLHGSSASLGPARTSLAR